MARIPGNYNASRKELKDFAKKQVKCEANVVARVYDRTIFDGRNYSTIELEKRIIIKDLKIELLNDSTQKVYVDHLWLSKSLFNNPDDFDDLIKLFKTAKKIKINFEGLVNIYIKNNAYNESTKKMHSNFEYGIRDIVIKEKKYIEKIEKKKTEKKKFYKNKIEKVKIDVSNHKARNPEFGFSTLKEVSNKIDAIANNIKLEYGVKVNEFNKLRGEINKVKRKYKEFEDVVSSCISLTSKINRLVYTK